MLGSSIGSPLTIASYVFHPSLDIIGFYCQHFLKGVGRTVGLQSPDFHFTEPLTAKLGFTTQWLLGNQAVWTG